MTDSISQVLDGQAAGAGAKKFDMDEILNCMHCGFCLPTCPTFQLTGFETQSPRGRIALMKGVAQGRLPVDSEFEDNMYACLGCRACETACPAGVEYGSLIETAREVVQDTKQMHGSSALMRRVIFKELFMHPKRLRMVGFLLWLSQSTRLQSLANRLGIVEMLSHKMAVLNQAIDPIASPVQRKYRSHVISPAGNLSAQAEPHWNHNSAMRPTRVGMFTGCMMDMMFFATNQATARVLSHANCEVEFVSGQYCCGALHAHSGEKSDAIVLAKRNIMAFEKANVDIIVNNAGGCGAALKEYAHWLKSDPAWHERAKQFVAKVRDVNELLAELPQLTFSKHLHARVTYQDSCHLAHGQGVRNQPRQLLRSIPGVEYVELPNAEKCCGSAGIYNITNFDNSMNILDEKMKHVDVTNAEVVATSNPGCLIQMKLGIERAGLTGRVRAVHIMDLLDEVL